MADIDHIMGQQEAQISSLQVDVTESKSDIKKMREDIHDIKLMLAESRGGWKVIMLLAGISGTIGAILSQFIPALFHK